MRIPALPFAMVAIVALCCPALAQERTDWSMTATFKPTGKVCVLRFSVPKGSFWLTMEHVPAKGSRPPQAYFKLGGLPPYLQDQKAGLRDIRLSVDDGWAKAALKGDWRKGTKDNDSRFQFGLPYEDLLGEIAKSWTLKVEATFGTTNSQAYQFDLKGSSAPVAAYSACVGKAS